MAQETESFSDNASDDELVERSNLGEDNRPTSTPTTQIESAAGSALGQVVTSDTVTITDPRKQLKLVEADHAMTPSPSQTDNRQTVPTVANETSAPAPVENVVPEVQEPERGYISDKFYVPVRSLPSADGRVVHNGLKSGTPLTVLSIQDDWARIRTDLDQRGWIQARYVSKKPIARTLLIEKEQAYKALDQRYTEQKSTVTELREQLASRDTDLGEVNGENQALKRQLSAFSGNGGDPTMLNDQIQSLVEQNHLLTQENDVLKARLTDFDSDEFHRSFLYGAFAVFLGAILSVLIPKLRGRKRLAGWQ
jgi:SH3 domain protein